MKACDLGQRPDDWINFFKPVMHRLRGGKNFLHLLRSYFSVVNRFPFHAIGQINGRVNLHQLRLDSVALVFYVPKEIKRNHCQKSEDK
jgi:hypothetical protein